MDNIKVNAAKKKVKALKDWYLTVCIFTIGTIMMYFFSNYIMSIGTPNFVRWIFVGVVVLWWTIVLVKWLHINNKLPKIISRWEEKQIQKYMNQGENESGKYS